MEFKVVALCCFCSYHRSRQRCGGSKPTRSCARLRPWSLFMSWLHQGSELFLCIIDAGVRIAEVIQWEGAAKRSKGSRACHCKHCRGWEEGIGCNRSQCWVVTEYVRPFATANQVSPLKQSTTVLQNIFSWIGWEPLWLSFLTLSFMPLR